MGCVFTRALGLSLFLMISFLQANTHINVHQDLKDVKLWEVRIIALYALAVFVISIFQDNNNSFSGSYPSKRIGEDSCQCRHSYVGLWRFQFNPWEVRVNIRQYLLGFIWLNYEFLSTQFYLPVLHMGFLQWVKLISCIQIWP
jgi:hypothetical protein